MNAQVNVPEAVNNFVTLSKINVNGHTEKKGRFTYLSWTFAVSEAMKVDPMTVWAFREPMVFPDGTMMVHCDVTMFGKSTYMFLPVMNNQNKAISNPNAFDVNSAMMRCLVKAIAAHGLGLYIYAGEDLPEEEKQAKQQSMQQPATTETECQQGLNDIKNAQSKADLDKPYNYFVGTQFESQITTACQAKCDQMGWQ
ncbi:DUF1071 domain-containing protein [Acinetobacter pragensis]|uniref:Sak single strand annealing protein n=1 Tax=Acinetobacter pragensis TaxID=1806892 RepID=UPI00333FAE9B